MNNDLVEAPCMFRGIVGYNHNMEEMAKDGYKPLIEEGQGSCFEYIERADHIVKRWYEPAYDYRAERAKLYPSVGDMIDAFCKAYNNEPEELQELMAQRDIIKQTIKKPEND